MVDFIQWRDTWLLDIPEVDRENRQLVALLNRAARHLGCPEALPGARPQVRHERVMCRMMQDLGEHVRRHFEHEEAYMRGVVYPDYEIHCYEHLTLLAEYAELMRDVRDQGLVCLDLDTLDSLKGWLIGHIAGADRRFGDYYRDTRSGVLHRKPDPFSRYWLSRAQGQ